MSVVETNIYNNLKSQAEVVFRHIRAGSYSTRRRYFSAFLRFLAFLAAEFRLQKIGNIDGKHLIAYVLHMESLDYGASTIKTELSAIRFVHDYIPGARHRLPDNEHLGTELPKRVFADVDRSWTPEEYTRMCDIARSEALAEYARAMTVARYSGLRVHELFRLDSATVRKALRDNKLPIKGKNGRNREVPLAEESRDALADQLALTPPGQKLFVPADMHTDRAINRLELFVYRHQDDIRDPTQPIRPSFHGLRHTYAAEQYRRLRQKGVSKFDAYLMVSALIGHNRGDVTRQYISSVDEDEF